MAILLDSTPAKGNIKSSINNIVDLIWSLAENNYLNATKSTLAIIQKHHSKNLTLEQLAWSLWLDTVVLGLNDFFRTANLTRKPASKEEFRDLLMNVLNQSALISREDKVGLTSETIVAHRKLAVFIALSENIATIAAAVDPDHIQKTDFLERRLSESIGYALNYVLIHSVDRYTPLITALAIDAVTMVQRSDEWRSYRETLRRAVSEDTIFAQPKDGATLSEIYIRLRCFSRLKLEENSVFLKKRKPTVKIKVQWLDDSILQWLAAKCKKDQIRIITGAPGSGKSSSAKMLSHRISYAGEYNVFFVPLQGRDVSGEVNGILEKQVEISKGGGGLAFNPATTLREDQKPLLLIFDGLDEIKRNDQGGPDTTRKFIGNLRSWLTQINAASELAFVKAIILGRPQAADDAASELSIDRTYVLNTAPISVLSEGDFARIGEHKIQIDDPYELCKLEQRYELWDRCSRWFDDDYSEPPEGFFGNELSDLTKEPLLLYLLFVSGFAGKRWREAAENRNRVYREIFSSIHQRDVDEKGDSLKKDVNDKGRFFILMECLGLAAWRGGGRTGDDTVFVKLRDQVYSPKTKKDFAEVASADLKNVALQIYTQQSSEDVPGYEFIHKSFAEYLTARALVEAATRWLYNYSTDPIDFLQHWCRLTSGQEISPDLRRFVYDEVRLKFADGISHDPNTISEFREICANFMDVFSAILEQGFPVHRVDWIDGGAPNWRELEEYQKNAELSAELIFDAFACVSYPSEHFQSKTQNAWNSGPLKPEMAASSSFSNYVDRYQHRYLRLAKTVGSKPVGLRPVFGLSRLHVKKQEISLRRNILRVSPYMVFEGCVFYGRIHSDFSAFGTKFIDCTFSFGCRFMGNFRNVKFQNCIFDRMKFFRADFAVSKCLSSNFVKCSILESNFRGLSGLRIEHFDEVYFNSQSTLPKTLKELQSRDDEYYYLIE